MLKQNKDHNNQHTSRVKLQCVELLLLLLHCFGWQVEEMSWGPCGFWVVFVLVLVFVCVCGGVVGS